MVIDDEGRKLNDIERKHKSMVKTKLTMEENRNIRTQR